MSDLRADLLAWISEREARGPGYSFALALKALRGELEAHKWSTPNVPATASERWYRCVGCAASYPDGEACPTVRRLHAALIGGE